MITISKPFLTENNGKIRLNSEIGINTEKSIVWFEVEPQFGDYLCVERSDAFVIGILNYAMRNKHDIACEAPMGEYLYYNLIHHFIPALHDSGNDMYATKITAQIDSNTLPNAGAVGTGISCGVDSLHAISQNNDSKLSRHKITHLAFNNVGAHGEGEKAQELFAKRRTKSRRFAEEEGFVYVESDSNIMDIIPQEHYLTHIYTSTFAILCLQKLYSVYYYASSRPYSDFRLFENELNSPDLYELLSVFCFSTDNLTIYSEGGNLSRFEKTKRISEYSPSFRHLNVCVVSADNCGVCPKCRRTLTDLDALGVLDNFGEVFDVEYYKKNRRWYLAKAHAYYKTGNPYAKDSYSILKDQISLSVRVKSIPTQIFLKVDHMKEGRRKKGLLTIVNILIKLQG